MPTLTQRALELMSSRVERPNAAARTRKELQIEREEERKSGTGGDEAWDHAYQAMMNRRLAGTAEATRTFQLRNWYDLWEDTNTKRRRTKWKWTNSQVPTDQPIFEAVSRENHYTDFVDSTLAIWKLNRILSAWSDAEGELEALISSTRCICHSAREVLAVLTVLKLFYRFSFHRF